MTGKVIYNVSLALKTSDYLEQSEWYVIGGPVSPQCLYARAEMLYKEHIQLTLFNSKKQ